METLVIYFSQKGKTKEAAGRIAQLSGADLAEIKTHKSYRMSYRKTVFTSLKEILLNEKKFRIKGVCRHEDHPDYGCALPYAAICHDLMLIQQMGANSIRTAHYPNDEIFLDLCDELGILVWEENHASSSF